MYKDLAISEALARELRRVPEEDRTIKARGPCFSHARDENKPPNIPSFYDCHSRGGRVDYIIAVHSLTLCPVKFESSIPPTRYCNNIPGIALWCSVYWKTSPPVTPACEWKPNQTKLNLTVQEYVSLKVFDLVASSKGELERTRR